jgi:pimeloyl-ACP methyl ester carboxylesterase
VVLGLSAACTPGDGELTSASATSPERPASSADETAGTDTGGWGPGPLEWIECGLPRGGRCAELTVPLDWDDPGGPSIDLMIGRIPAEDDPIGPLLVNPGGPGASGLDFLAADPVSGDLARRFDLISWDPRGVGASEDLTCGDGVAEMLAADPSPDDDAERTVLDRSAAAVASQCGELDGDLLAHLGTADAARDLEAIRRAIGASQVSYLGFSYGTHIGLEYAEQFPDRARAMVLDGVVDPALGYEATLLGQVAGFDAAFAASAEGCSAAGATRCGVADLAGAYDRVARAVEAEPLTGGELPVGPAVLATAAIQTMYAADGWLTLGPALASALDGDGAELWELASGYYSFGDFTSYAAVFCIDRPPPQGAEAYRAFAEEAARRSPRFGAAVANELAVCATWPAAAVDAAAPIAAAGSPPVLVVGNTGDAATPYANAVAVAEALEDATLLTVRNDGHTAYLADRCARSAIDTYLLQLELPEDGRVCG